MDPRGAIPRLAPLHLALPALLAAACGGSAPDSGPAPSGALAPLAARMLRGDYAEAAARLADLVEKHPTDPRPRELLALCQLELHRPEDAERSFRALREIRSGDLRDDLGLSRALELQGRLPEAWDAAQAALTRAPRSADVLFAVGQLAVRRNDDAAAKERLEKALRMEPWSDASAAAHHALAGIAQRAGDGTTAAARRALYEKTFEWTSRRTSLERVLAADERNDKARRALASLHREAGLGKQAAALLAPLVAAAPKDVVLRLEYAEALDLAGEIDRSRALLAPLLEGPSREPAAFRIVAARECRAGRLADALAALRAGLDADPTASREPALVDVAREIETSARAAGAQEFEREARAILARLGR